MVHRKKRNTPASKSRVRPEKKTLLSEEEQEALRLEAYMMMSLMEESSLALFSPETTRCYLIDEFWMHRWELYTGYHELMREQAPKDSFG